VLAAKAYQASPATISMSSSRALRARYPEIAHAVDEWIRWHIGEHWAMALTSRANAWPSTRAADLDIKPAWQHPPKAR